MRKAFVVLLAMAGSVSAQSVYLRVDTISEGGRTTKSSSSGYGSFERFQKHEVELKITLRNMHTVAHTYSVEWQFFARDLQTRKTRVHDSGTNSVPLKAGETKNFEIKSAALKTETRGTADRYSASQQTVGEKPNGYLVLVKEGGTPLAVEASDTTLKRSYQTAINTARLQPKPAAPPPTAQPKPSPPQPAPQPPQ